MQFTDALLIDRAHRTPDGYLRVVAKAARTGIQKYRGAEIDPEGKHFAADQVVNVYRPPEEVFDAEAVASFIGRPITDDHPKVAVNASNWRDHSRGVVGGAVKDGEWLRFDLALMDADLVAKVDAGKRQLSNGYAAEIEIGDGTTPTGEAYQATQRHIRGNHVAVVRIARAGPDAVIPDGGNKLFETCDAAAVILGPAEDQETKMPHTLIIDGLQVPNVSDEAKAAIEKLQGQLKDANGATAAAEQALKDATSAHDKAIGAKDAEIADLKGKVADEATIDARASAKADVLAKAKAVLGDKAPDFAGKTVAEVRRMTVAAKVGDEAVADKSDDYVEARFDALTAGAKAVVPIHSPTTADADKEVASAHAAMVKDMQDAWKPKPAQAA